MNTRLQLKRKLSDLDIKVPIKQLKYEDHEVTDNSKESLLKDIKGCFVKVTSDIDISNFKQDVKEDLFKPIESDIIKQSPNTELEICQFCNKSFKKSWMKRHLVSHRRTKKCDDCQKSFTEHGFPHHTCANEKQKLLPEFIICEICNHKVKQYNIKRHYRGHANRKRPIKQHVVKQPNVKKKNYICPICGKNQISKFRLERHQRGHENQKRYPCLECDLSFRFLVELVRHVSLIHRKITDGRVQCIFCKEIYLAIAHHLRTHEKKQFTCEKCGSNLPNKTAYKSHLRIHQKLAERNCDRVVLPRVKTDIAIQKPFKCELCGLRCSNENQLMYHRRLHIDVYSYPCPYCDFKTFKSKSELYNHINHQHRYFPSSHSQCPHCNLVLLSTNMQRHLKSHQSDEYECEICDETFVSMYHMKRHVGKIHSSKKRKLTGLEKFMKKYSKTKINLKKVPCLHCTNKVIISHMKTHLKNHQKFKCLMCDKMFFERSQLKRHELCHNTCSQRCPVCSQSFLSHIRLMAHLKMYHKFAFSFSKACSRCDIYQYISDFN